VTTPIQCTFDHVHVYCSDFDATERWFREGLGAELVERTEAPGVRTGRLRVGGATLLIRSAREGEKLAPGLVDRHFGTDHFGLRVADIDATVAELRGRGVVIDVEPWDISPKLRIAFVRGPDNVRIELVQPR
jgi:catechol 2,3-dioxygenase-like lactoylglutathione lyase family enzyme